MSAARETRINFVGQRTYFESSALSSAVNGIRPQFFDFRVGDDPETLRHRLNSNPADVTIVFKPETIPPGLISDVTGEKIGWFTEPLPRPMAAPSRPFNDPDAPANPEQDRNLAAIAAADLERRLASARTVDRSNFDKFIVFDSQIVDTVAQFVPVWRALPLPVDDTYFQEVPAKPNVPPRIGFFGRPTLHRDLMLGPSLHAFDVQYIAHGVFGNDLREMAFKLDVAINLHNERYPNFENRVSLHLAAANLVISEPIDPTHGLEPGIDFLEIMTPKELYIVLEELVNYPDSFTMMRRRGRQKAEYFRASSVYQHLISEI